MHAITFVSRWVSRGRRSITRRVLARAAVPAILALPLPYARAQDNPEDRPYPHGDWTEDCTLCHQEPWIPVRPTGEFKHSPNFPLKGAHATAACAQCHTSLDFEKKPAASCVSCHQDIHRGELGLDCSRCHEPTDFHNRPAFARIHRTFRFPLQGAHTTAACESCHQPRGQGQLQYSGVGTACSDCHASPGFPDATQAPAWHANAGFPADCLVCHTDQRPGFRPATNFSHPASGSFDLSSAHATLTCAECHEPSGYAITFTGDCTLCHQAEYQRAPGHVAASFPRDCTLCHNRSTFSGASFNHAAATAFPLTGRHVGLSCTECHGDGVFAGRSTACNSCHQADVAAATNPNHGLAGFSSQCETCHTTTGFRPVTTGFVHRSTADFSATQGAHTGLTCVECHGTQPYSSASAVCSTCHQAQFAGTTNPSHTQAGFASDCTQCHTIQYPGFRPAPRFAHAAQGSFDLTSAHATVTCNDCHQSRGYAISFTGDCTLCHQADYQGAPGHVASDFPRDCTLCHNRSTFAGATFNHASTAFIEYSWPRHSIASCASCHTGGVYAGTPSNCYDCHYHRAQFDAQTDPSHIGANFGRTKTDCTTCHTSQSTFVGGRYAAHDTRDMQIYTGRHRGRWDACSDCHTTTSNYMTVSCASCHPKATIDREHQGESGYAYDPPLCVSCHRLK